MNNINKRLIDLSDLNKNASQAWISAIESATSNNLIKCKICINKNIECTISRGNCVPCQTIGCNTMANWRCLKISENTYKRYKKEHSWKCQKYND